MEQNELGTQEAGTAEVVEKETNEETNEETSNEKVETFTQAEIDRRVSQAIKTHEKKIEEKIKADYATQMEEEKLKSEGKYEELLQRVQEREEREKLTKRTYGYLREKNLLDIASVFDQDTSSFEGRQAVAELINNKIKEGINKGIAQKIETPLPEQGDKKTNIDAPLDVNNFNINSDSWKAHKAKYKI